MVFKDRTNIKYGKLTAIEYLGNSMWRCRCECGNEKNVYGGHLESGHTKSCGCIRPPRTNLYGQHFGKLTVLDWNGGGEWLCQCDCGNQTLVKTSNLKSGNTKSCGCLQKARASELTFKSLVGKKFGRLTAIERVKKDAKYVYYKCKCECGKETIVSASNLRTGTTKSCGCYKKEETERRNTIDLIGKRFGKLTVIEKTAERSNRSVMWKCKCDCGNIKIINGSSLRQGLARSCGCSTISHGEEKILNLLKDNDIPFFYNEPYFDDLIIKKRKGRYDFILYPDDAKQIRLIEFDGEQHFKEWDLGRETLQERKENDMIKNNYALEHNIPLVRIPYWEKDNINLEMILGNKFLVQTAEVPDIEEAEEENKNE